jgi:signal-transduction protein with cAMP-binding, CBS, and nucleotidyltransferase domain
MTLLLADLIEGMERIIPVSEEFKFVLFKAAERMDVAKKAILLKPDQLCNYLYFIEQGVLGCYKIHGDKKIYNWLMLGGDIATSVDSFNNRVPSSEYIVTLTPCVLYLLSYSKLMEISDKYVEMRIIRQYYTDKYHLQTRQIEEARKLGHEYLYDFLLREWPGIETLVPNAVLASYLGISESTLYEMKRRRRKYK